MAGVLVPVQRFSSYDRSRRHLTDIYNSERKGDKRDDMNIIALWNAKVKLHKNLYPPPLRYITTIKNQGIIIIVSLTNYCIEERCLS